MSTLVDQARRLADRFETPGFSEDTARIAVLLRQLAAALEAQQAGGEPVHQYRKQRCANWYDGHPDHLDGGGPYETRVLYTHPAPVQQGDALRAALEDLTHQVDWFVQEQGSHGFCTQQAHAALAAQPAAERVALTDDMVLKAARELCKIHAGECQVNEQDTWNIYADQFKRDARAALEAAGITATSGKESGND